jgi:hypothetical protein
VFKHCGTTSGQGEVGIGGEGLEEEGVGTGIPELLETGLTGVEDEDGTEGVEHPGPILPFEQGTSGTGTLELGTWGTGTLEPGMFGTGTLELGVTGTTGAELEGPAGTEQPGPEPPLAHGTGAEELEGDGT